MAPEADIEESAVSRPWRRALRIALLAAALLAVLAVALLWANRREIADNVIADQLAARGIPATYEIESIGGARQVLRDIVIGDPARPDLTIERAEVTVRYRLGLPGIARLVLVRPRLYGSWRDGQPSFGALDPLLFTGEEVPFELLDLDLAIVDGRALIESEAGPVGVKLAGEGQLRGGFAGELAATAPRLAAGGCEAERATLYGRVSVTARRPEFEGPVRLAGLTCAGQDIELGATALQVSARADEALAVFEGDAGLRAGAARVGAARLAGARGEARFAWRDGGLTASYDLVGAGLRTTQAAVDRIEMDGTVRTRRGFGRIELETDFAGAGLRPGEALERGLASAARAGEGTLLAPLLARVRAGLATESRGSAFAGQATLRRTGTRLGLLIPQAALRGGGGDTVFSLSRFQLALEDRREPRFSGAFATGGDNLPRVSGTMEQGLRDGVSLRLAMAEYRAGDASLAVPELAIAGDADGGFGFAGRVEADGALPGGDVRGLRLPLSGRWSPGGGLAAWDRCAEVGFESLRYAGLTLERQGLTLCPARGAPILRLDDRGLRLAAGATSLRLAGTLGETPIRIRSGPLGFAWPGSLSARQLDIELGPAETAQRFLVSDLTARLGGEVAGRFTGADVRLFAVPLDVLGATGDWAYANGRLTLSGAAFRLQDRQEIDRFAPLAARGATLTLADNVVTADAVLRHPASDAVVTRAAIRHDLSSARGHADLLVDDLTFGRGFQPHDLTENARGVVSLVSGTVNGAGRIEWDENAVTSTGRFSSAGLDFAAPFGPVQGAAGTVVFSDLLGLTTAPGQRITVASVNPGIEVNDGEVTFELTGGQVLEVEGAVWPFMGGTLTMRPVTLNLGLSEVRNYVFEIVGLDAATFVARMEMANLNASGTFDGTVPIVFDSAGYGRIEGGLLISRPPGGNVSYVGALTYEDLSPIANFAFEALKSLDYSQMRVEMNGNLAGEIVTNVRFDGVSQGEGARRNFLTRRIGRLPFRFDVNIRAAFHQLLANIKSMYDPASVRDPRELGLLDSEGNIIQRESTGAPAPPVQPPDPIPDEATIQRRESEDTP